MIPASELQTMRDTLQRAIYSGTRRVQYRDRLTEYNSIDEMRKALADLDASIAVAAGTAPPSFTLAMHSRD